jgi:hypothetical protein
VPVVNGEAVGLPSLSMAAMQPGKGKAVGLPGWARSPAPDLIAGNRGTAMPLSLGEARTSQFVLTAGDQQ